MDEQGDKEWRCRKCGTLLGVERKRRLHLKYKTAQYVSDGACEGRLPPVRRDRIRCTDPVLSG